jgi:hypothetical protein
LKEIEEDENSGEIVHVHGLEELILLNCQYYPRWIYRLNAILIKFPVAFFKEIGKNNPKIHLEPQ